MPPNARKFPWTLGFDGINHETNAHETGLYWFAVSGSNLSLGSGSDTKEAEEPKSSMALIERERLNPISLKLWASGKEFESSTATCSDDYKHNRLFKFVMVRNVTTVKQVA